MKTIMTKIVALLAICMIGFSSNAQPGISTISLKGQWKFKIGDDIQWANPKFNDANWSSIRVPDRWENQGYNGYDGYAWYRLNIVLPKELENHQLVLNAGYIDDVDQVYFNGVKIGQSGTFPPDYQSAYNAQRIYPIPGSLVQAGKQNLFAIRVYDSQLEGGIVRGDVKIESKGIVVNPTIDLSGQWQISRGKNFVASEAQSIVVPGQWENQGMRNYDGFATYRKEFDVSPKLAQQLLVLMAGRIDDLDEVYINDIFIGGTGSFSTLYCDYHYNQFRNYSIPQGVIRSGKNEIKIKVYDRGSEGGIMEGIVGIYTLRSFQEYWRHKRK
jgi:hypothetical protein